MGKFINFVEIGGNMNMHHCLRGWTPLRLLWCIEDYYLLYLLSLKTVIYFAYFLLLPLRRTRTSRRPSSAETNLNEVTRPYDCVILLSSHPRMPTV